MFGKFAWVLGAVLVSAVGSANAQSAPDKPRYREDVTVCSWMEDEYGKFLLCEETTVECVEDDAAGASYCSTVEDDSTPSGP